MQTISLCDQACRVIRVRDPSFGIVSWQAVHPAARSRQKSSRRLRSASWDVYSFELASLSFGLEDIWGVLMLMLTRREPIRTDQDLVELYGAA